MTSDLHSLAAAYSLDALDADERRRFESHLSACADCSAEVAEFSAVTEALAESSAVAPPSHLKESVMSRLGAVEQERVSPTPEPAVDAAIVDLTERRRRRAPLLGLFAAAAAVAIIAVGAVILSANRGGSGFDELANASDAVVTELEGDGGTFVVAYSAELDRVALRGDGVGDLEPGLRYALWAIADGTAIPVGLFEPDGGSIDEVTEFADVGAEAWGITIEPETGSDTPTPPIISLGEV